MRNRIRGIWNSSTLLVARSLTEGLINAGGIYAVVEGLYKLIHDKSFEDMIGENKALFSVVLTLAVGSLGVYAYSEKTAAQDAIEENIRYQELIEARLSTLEQKSTPSTGLDLFDRSHSFEMSNTVKDQSRSDINLTLLPSTAKKS